MKKISLIPLLLLFFAGLFNACSSGVSYASQLDAEKAQISDYIKRNGINVLSDFPTGDWGEKDYVKTSSGLYFHLFNKGDVSGSYKLDTNDIVTPRFYEYTLSAKCDTTRRNWSVIDYPNPATFVFGRASGACAAFYEAVSYMKYNNSEALIIAPSKIGFYPTSSDVIPYGYHLKITFEKRN